MLDAGIAGLGKEHKEEVHRQAKEGALCVRHKERNVVKEAKDQRR